MPLDSVFSFYPFAIYCAVLGVLVLLLQ